MTGKIPTFGAEGPLGFSDLVRIASARRAVILKVAAAAMAVYGMAAGISAVERALHVPPLAIAALGLLLAIGSGAVSLAHEAPFLTGLWVAVPLGRDTIEIGTPLFFDIGVFGVVFGAATAVLLRLENGGTR